MLCLSIFGRYALQNLAGSVPRSTVPYSATASSLCENSEILAIVLATNFSQLVDHSPRLSFKEVFAMSYPPGFGAALGSHQPNGDSRMDGDFFGQLSPEEIEKKSRKWRTGQKRRFNEKRRRGGGAGVDFGKAVSPRIDRHRARYRMLWRMEDRRT